MATTTDPVPSDSAANFVYNVEKLDEIVTGAAATYTDRLGAVRSTAAGAMARIAALNPRGAWVTATLYQPRDLVLVAGIWYIALDTHTSGATFAGDISVHWRPEQGVTATDLSDATSASNGGQRLSLGFQHNYASGTIGKAMRDRVWSITDYPWLAVGDGVADNYAAILAAQTALSAAGGGSLLIPRGTFRIHTAIARVPNVDFEGCGWSSILAPVSCGAFTYAFTTGFGRSQTHNMWIQGVAAASEIAIFQEGTLNDADELYGITIEDNAITGFATAIKFRNMRNGNIARNWIQEVNKGIDLTGKHIVCRIQENEIVRAAAADAGSIGINLASFNFTSGTGIVTPEGIQVNRNQIYGFKTCINAASGNVVNLVQNDILASVYGIEFTSVANVLNILDNTVQLVDLAPGAARAGIIGHSMNSPLATNVNIERNDLLSAGTTAARGVQINDSDNTNQFNVNVVRNYFQDWDAYDIDLFSAGNVNIENNRCESDGVTQSIRVNGIVAGRPVFIDKNTCAKAIAYVQSEFDSGLLQIGTNVINGTTTSYGRAAPTTPTYSAGAFTSGGTQTWTVDAGDVLTYAYTFNGKMMTVYFSISNTAVSGTPDPALAIAIPAGRTAKKATTNPVLVVDNGARSVGYCSVTADGTKINIRKSDVSNWTASAGSTQVQGQITFEV